MSILDMDVTTRREAGSIRTRRFATVRKGYDPDQVHHYLEQVADWVDDLETDLATARAELRTMPVPRAVPEHMQPTVTSGQADPFAALGTRVADLLRSAEDHARSIREEADASAERTLEEAREEALRVRRRAQEESEAVREAAEEQAEATRRLAQDE